jgi:hypothetical protein
MRFEMVVQGLVMGKGSPIGIADLNLSLASRFERLWKWNVLSKDT